MDRLLLFLLVASTNGPVRQQLSDLLRAAGYLVLQAGNLEELLRQMAVPLRLLLVEGELVHNCYRLREESELRDCFLLALSDQPVEGADRVLPRRFRPEELVQIVHERMAAPRTGLPSIVLHIFRGLIDGLVSHVAILNTKGTILAVNEPWRTFACRNGADPALLSEGANYLRVCENACGPEEAEARAFAENLRQVLYGQRDSFTHEYPCHSSSELRWFVARVSRLIIGGQHYVMVSHENITDRKRVETELQEASQQITDILESIADGFAAIGANGEVRYVNQALEKFLGQRRDALLGQPIWELVPESLGPTLRAELEQSVVGKKALISEQYFPAAVCWGEVHLCPASEGMLLYVRDITELRQVREAHARNQAERLDRLEREARELHNLVYRPVSHTETGRMQLTAADLHQQWVSHYEEILDLALEQRAYRVVNQTTERLRALGQRMGYAGAGPRDVIDVHTSALQARMRSVLPGRYYAYVEESRLLLIELMGNLVLYYRGAQPPPTP